MIININNFFYSYWEETKKRKDEECIEIYNKKLEVFNILTEKQETRKYKLVHNYEEQNN